jgi:hypothetical protein
LQVQDFRNVLSRKDVVAAADPFTESQTTEQLAHFSKRDIRVRGTAQNAIQECVWWTHIPIEYLP